MKTILTFLLSALCLPVFGATTFTEFYCLNGGSNRYAGSVASTTPVKAILAGNWTNSTGTFFSSGADLSAVTVGMWASVTTNADSRTYFVGQVTAVDDTADTVTVSLTRQSGTNPSDGVGNRDLFVGGGWLGPNGTEWFPFNFCEGKMTNSSGNSQRINFKRDRLYSVTAGVTITLPITGSANNTGVIRVQGYNSTPGDLAFVQGAQFPEITGSGSGFTFMTLNCKNIDFWNLSFSTNGTSGSSDGVTTSTATECSFNQCTFHDMRGNGLVFTTVNHAYSCEAYRCNLNNSSGKAGFNFTSSGIMAMNNFAHDNTTANSAGFQLDGGINLVGNIAMSNGASGFRFTADVTQSIISCAAVGNGGSAFEFAGSVGPVGDSMLVNMIHNSAFANGGSAVQLNNNAGSQYLNGRINGLLLGTGSMTNAAGGFRTSYGITTDGSNFQGIEVVNVQYAASGVTPWAAPDTGNYTITLPAAECLSTNFYTQSFTNRTFTGTIGYADFGSATHRNPAVANNSGVQ